MKFQTRLILFILLAALPFMLTKFIKTQSCTEYLLWEYILGYIAFGVMYSGYISFVYIIMTTKKN